MDKVLREGDSGLGFPDPIPTGSRPMSAAERKHYQEKDEEELQRRFETLIRARRSSVTGLTIPEGLRNAITTALVAVAAVLLLILVTQVAALWGNVQNLPLPGRIVVVVLAGASAAALLFVGFRLARAFLRVQRSERVPIGILRELAERGRLQVLAQAREEQARRSLEGYLQTYVLEDEELIGRALFTAGEVESLRAARRQLLDDPDSETGAWLQEFQRTFQKTLDDAAKRRIGSYSKKAGLITAALPNGLLDASLMLNLGLLMVADLGLIYQLRPTGAESTVILAKAIGIAYLASRLEDGIDPISESVVDAVMDAGASVLTQRLTSFVSQKAAEGATNALLVYRLGRGVVAQLQPTRRD